VQQVGETLVDSYLQVIGRAVGEESDVDGLQDAEVDVLDAGLGIGLRADADHH